MNPLNTQELIFFSEQMNMILRSGISALEGVTIMAEDAGDAQGASLLKKICESMEQGESFCQALTGTNAFPPYFLHMTEIGEQSGRLEQVMEALARYYRQQTEISSAIRSAVTYPLTMLGMMAVVIMVLIIKVMPIFDQVFRQLGGGLSGFSLGIFHLGQLLSRYSAVLVGLVLLLAVLILYFAVTKTGRARFGQLSARLPFTKKLSLKIATSRFAAGMSLCLKSGLDTDQSLEMVARLTDHPVLQEKTAFCRKALEEDHDFDSAITKSGIFSGIQARMVSIGFKTGSMDEVMEKIAGQYEEEATETISRAISFVEPTLVALLSILVGLILLSVMLPLMSIMSTLG